MKTCRINVKMIIYIDILKCRFDLYAPSFHRKTFFSTLRIGEKTFLWGVISLRNIRHSFSMRLWQWQNSLHSRGMKNLSSWLFIMLQYLYLLSLIFSLKRKTQYFVYCKTNYSASNIILTNIPLPGFIYIFCSVVYVSRQRLYIQTHRF